MYLFEPFKNIILYSLKCSVRILREWSCLNKAAFITKAVSSKNHAFRITWIGIIFFSSNLVVGQVGIGTSVPSPKSVLDLTSTSKGFLLPRMSTVQRTAILPAPVIDKGMQVFDTDTNTIWFWNGNAWIEVINRNIYNTNGSLTSNRTVDQGSNMLSFLSSSSSPNAFSIDGSTFSTDTFNNRVGIGTAAPVTSLDIEGTMRFSPAPAANVPVNSRSLTSLQANRSTGLVAYAPPGFTTSSGGFIPGGSNSPYTIATLPVNNTIVRVRFVCHVDQSTDANNSDAAAYTYGEFTIIGTGTSNPIKIVERTIKDSNGVSKALTVSTSTSMAWDNNSQGITTININQSTGVFTINNTQGSLSYVFEMLGGI